MNLSPKAALFGEGKKDEAEKKAAARAAFYLKKVKNLQAKADAAEAARWQARYEANDFRKSTEESLAKMESEINSLLAKKNTAEERLFRFEQEALELKGMAEEKKAALSDFRNLLSVKCEGLRERLDDDFPYDLTGRIQALNRVSGAAATGRDLALVLRQALEYRAGQLSLSETVSLEDVQVADSANTEPAYLLRLGTVFLGKASKVSDRAGLFLNTGRLTAGRYQYFDALPAGVQAAVAKGIRAFAKGGADVVMLPMDLLQSPAILKEYSGRDTGTLGSRLVRLFKSGGIMMIPLFLLMIWALVIIVERFIALRKRRANAERLMDAVMPQIASGDLNQTNQIIADSDTALGRILKAVLFSAREYYNRDAAERALAEAMLQETPELEKRLSTLAVIGGAAPLLGLLGTVTGMIQLFEVITVYGTNDPKLLAGGISEALVTTETGLIIAVPIMLIHNYFSNLLGRIRVDLERYSLKILNAIWPKEG
jgi:biopolymer transport protein ExbB